ncbi:hypothetical protein ETR_17921 [Erwinia tracheiphila PSU-1]|nr:hypothetical protein ETR_17921 [Erwinia tracheiphila PSU-1]
MEARTGCAIRIRKVNLLPLSENPSLSLRPAKTARAVAMLIATVSAKPLNNLRLEENDQPGAGKSAEWTARHAHEK